jgi:hypothetical protein
MNHRTFTLSAIEKKLSFGLVQFAFIKNKGFNRTEINGIQKLVEEHQEQLLAGWNDFFNG